MSKKTTDETLGREAVKEYLQQYHTAVGKKRILEERHRVLSSELRAPSTGSAFRLTPPTKPTKTDGSVSVVFRISEVEDRIEEQREEMARLLLRHTTTLGVRESRHRRYTLSRAEETMDTPWGPVARKLSQGWGVRRQKPEYEDLARIAREQDLPLDQVRQQIR